MRHLAITERRQRAPKVIVKNQAMSRSSVYRALAETNDSGAGPGKQ